MSGKKKQHKHKLLGPDFPRTFLTLTPGRPWVKKFLPITGAAEKRPFWCGRPRFSARTSMTRRVFEKVCTKKFALIFWPLQWLRKFWSTPALLHRVVFSAALRVACCQKPHWKHTTLQLPYVGVDEPHSCGHLTCLTETQEAQRGGSGGECP